MNRPQIDDDFFFDLLQLVCSDTTQNIGNSIRVLSDLRALGHMCFRKCRASLNLNFVSSTLSPPRTACPVWCATDAPRMCADSPGTPLILLPNRGAKKGHS